MEFKDSEAQRLLRNTVRSYLEQKFPWSRLYAIEAGQERLVRSDLLEFAELGWLSLLAPESTGGVTLIDAAVVIEEFGYAAVPAPVRESNIAAYLLAAAPAADGVLEHVKALASGRRLYTVSEATRRRGRPVRAGDIAAPALTASHGKLKGVLPMVPFADLAEFVLAPLTTDEGPAFAVVSLQGARREQLKLIDRATYANVYFEDASLDNSLVLARGTQAESLHERCDALTTALSLIEVAGMMQRVLEMSAEYISHRVQFGRPVATFQAARHRAAELLMQTETTRWAAYHALWRFQEDPADTGEIWLAKHWAIRATDRIYQITHLLHGGVGVGMEYPLHLFTQQLNGFANHSGNMNEMVSRTVESLNLRVVPATG